MGGVDALEHADQDRTSRYLVEVRRVLIRAAILVWLTLAFVVATHVRTYNGTDNAGAYLDMFGHHLVVEWRGHPGVCIDCD